MFDDFDGLLITEFLVHIEGVKESSEKISFTS